MLRVAGDGSFVRGSGQRKQNENGPESRLDRPVLQYLLELMAESTVQKDGK